MQRISGPGATPGGEFTEGDPFLGVPTTYVTAAWLNTMQREALAILAAKGLTPDTANDAQMLDAIQQIANSAASDALADKLVQLTEPQFRRERAGPQVLFSSGELKSPFSSGIVVGATGGPPTSATKNTLLDNGYDGVGTLGTLPNQQHGHLWPYQCFGPQMQGDASVDDGFFPACLDGTGVNTYGSPQFVTTPGMLGGHGGRIKITTTGLLEAREVGSNFRLEVVLARNMRPDWNGGDGGETGAAGTFKTNRTMFFRSPLLNEASFTSGAMLCTVELEMRAYFHRQIYVFCRFYLCDLGGESDPYIETTRAAAFSYAGSVNLVDTTSRWCTLFKLDGNAGGAGFESPLVVCNTPLGGPGTTPPKNRQDSNGAVFNMLHQDVVLYPAPH